jgi:predicted secreted hydrolase
MWRYGLLGLGLLAVVIFGFSLIDSSGGDDVSASALMSAPQTDITGFTRAIAPYTWQFPRDYGPHPEFQTEWWYYTGNLADSNGRRFGYEFTIFRRAITPVTVESESEWRADQIYMAHFTVTDVQGDAFYHDQRLSRGGVDLAGATIEPRYRVWLDDWQVLAQNDDATLTTLRAESDSFAVNFTLEQVKPPVLQGEFGLSKKGFELGNASYYYSLPRLLTEGTLTVNGEMFTLSGASWMDHEFSTQALDKSAQGWDWFGLHLDGSRELVIGQFRLGEGGAQLAYTGVLVNPDGSTRKLDSQDFTITPTSTWTSPHTGAVYPAGWEIHITGDEPLRLVLTPLVADQELYGTGVDYWEGAVQITGDATGYGYAELTGYAQPMTGRF